MTKIADSKQISDENILRGNVLHLSLNVLEWIKIKTNEHCL